MQRVYSKPVPSLHLSLLLLPTMKGGLLRGPQLQGRSRMWLGPPWDSSVSKCSSGHPTPSEVASDIPVCERNLV